MRVQIPSPLLAMTLGKLLSLSASLHSQKYAGRKVGSLHRWLLLAFPKCSPQKQEGERGAQIECGVLARSMASHCFMINYRNPVETALPGDHTSWDGTDSCPCPGF